MIGEIIILKLKLIYTQTTGIYHSALAQAIRIMGMDITITHGGDIITMDGVIIITTGDTLLITTAILTSDGTIPIMDGVTQVIMAGIHHTTETITIITDNTIITEIILKVPEGEDLPTLVL